MASTYSTNLKIELIGSGEQAGTWGNTTNTNLGTTLEEAITGIATADFPSDANLTLAFNDVNTTQVFRNLVLNVTSTGSLTATRDLIVPTIEKQYFVWNNTSGGQSIVVKTSAGTGITVPNGAKMVLFADGTNVVEALTRINGTNIPASETLVTTDDTQTLTNKTVDLSSNTVTGTTAEFNTALSDGSFATLAGTETLTNKTVDLSSNTVTGTTAEFNTALSDGSFATLAGTETLTNKTVDLSSNTVTGTTAEFNTALSDGSFATLAGTETLTNKTITDPSGINADDIDYDNSTSGLTATDVQAAIDENAQAIQNISVAGLFAKATTRAVAWTKTGAGTAETATALTLEVNGGLVSVSSGTSITMPGSFTAGTDYAIWCAPNGTLEADASFTVAPTTNGRLIGGFHYAPGGNAAAQAGGNTTAQINEYSFWDLKFRPSCDDPRGMTLVADHFWSDIYLLNTDPDTNGTSANDKTIANGNADYPIIPDAFGGDGTTTYGSFTWFEAQEILGAYGKRAPTYSEFMQLAYGTTEEQDRGNDPVTTGFATSNTATNNGDEEFTSKWGVIQSTGVYYVWSRDFIADGTGTGGWNDITEGRGEVYTYSNSARAGLLGGGWGFTTRAGSRCSSWGTAPSFTGIDISARGVADHLILD